MEVLDDDGALVVCNMRIFTNQSFCVGCGCDVLGIIALATQLAIDAMKLRAARHLRRRLRAAAAAAAAAATG
jgi:hypothetical protein